METPKDKRLRQKNNHIKRQLEIAKSNGVPVKVPHKLHKSNVMNCGNPKCIMCSNPRKLWKELTMQEKKFLEDSGE
jgi:hypothetical protein